MELNLTNVTIFAEKLRTDLTSTKPPLIRSRRQLFRSYPNSFIGSEVIAWMLSEVQTGDNDSEKNNNATVAKNEDCSEEACASNEKDIELNAETVSQAMQKLVGFGILHSIHGDVPFKADSTIYRFTADDGSCSCVVEALVKGCRLHKTTLCPNCSLLQRVCEYGELVSEKCMRGSDLIAWVLEHGLATHREDAKRVCRLMHEHGILKPTSKQVTEFIDGRPFYIFGIDFEADPLTIKQFVTLTNDSQMLLAESPVSDAAAEKNVQHVRQLSGQLIDLSTSDTRSTQRRKNASSSSVGSDDSGYIDFSVNASVSPNNSSAALPSYTSLLTSDGKLTPEALMHPNAPFEKKELRIYPDPVGYGFIIRGSSPCYVKIVDPESPAGKSGLKKYQYIAEINNRDVTRKTYTEVEDLILNGPKFLIMTVMLPKEGAEDTAPCSLHQRKLSQSNESQQLSHSNSDPAMMNHMRRQSVPVNKTSTKWPTAQPWMKSRKASDFGLLLSGTNNFIR